MIKLIKCPTRRSLPKAPDGYQRQPNRPVPKLSRSQKRLYREQANIKRLALFKARREGVLTTSEDCDSIYEKWRGNKYA